MVLNLGNCRFLLFPTLTSLANFLPHCLLHECFNYCAFFFFFSYVIITGIIFFFFFSYIIITGNIFTKPKELSISRPLFKNVSLFLIFNSTLTCVLIIMHFFFF